MGNSRHRMRDGMRLVGIALGLTVPGTMWALTGEFPVLRRRAHVPIEGPALWLVLGGILAALAAGVRGVWTVWRGTFSVEDWTLLLPGLLALLLCTSGCVVALVPFPIV